MRIHRLVLGNGSWAQAQVACGESTALYASPNPADVTCPQCLGCLTPHQAPSDMAMVRHAPEASVTPQMRPQVKGIVRERSRPRSLPEKVFLAWVIDLCHTWQWRVYHTYDSRRSHPGFPDLVAVRQRRLIFAELKSSQGRVTATQNEWHEALAQIPGIEVYLWYPQMSTAIAACLAPEALRLQAQQQIAQAS
jgi:hypothetical protein